MAPASSDESSPGRIAPIAVIGAGAAGLTAAIFAGRAGVPALVLETRPKPGAKIRVSGGGRCNVLPSRLELGDFHTEGSDKSLRNVLFSWPLALVRAFFEDDLGVALEVEDTGKVFPASQRAQDIVDALLGECRRVGTTVLAPFRAVAVRCCDSALAPGESRVAGGATRFEIESETGVVLRARRIVIATGGLSLPKTGSDGFGFELARACGHVIEPTFPALVPLLSSDARWKQLAGISLPAKITALCGGRVLEERTGDFLFTHRGFSGPVVLDMSRHVAAPSSAGEVELQARWGAATIDWDRELRRPGKTTIGAILRDRLPRRLADLLASRAGLDPATRTSELGRDARKRLVEQLERCPLAISGDEGYRTAEVTAGGVRLADVHPKTLESRSVPGLHFAGEVLDAIGRIGGYNFLWAWVTGRKAGEGAAGAHGQRPE